MTSLAFRTLGATGPPSSTWGQVFWAALGSVAEEPAYHLPLSLPPQRRLWAGKASPCGPLCFLPIPIVHHPPICPLRSSSGTSLISPEPLPTAIWETKLLSLSSKPGRLPPWPPSVAKTFEPCILEPFHWEDTVLSTSHTLFIWRRVAECQAGQPEVICVLLKEPSCHPHLRVWARRRPGTLKGRVEGGPLAPPVLPWSVPVCLRRPHAPWFAGRASEGTMATGSAGIGVMVLIVTGVEGGLCA